MDAFSQISVIESSDREYLAVPDLGTLELFEQKHQVKLPQSYRHFVLTFGAGVLANIWSIAAPLAVDHPYELARFNQNSHGQPDDRVHECYGNPEYISQFLFFAEDGDHRYAWNTSEVTNTEVFEYAIYDFGWMNQLPCFADSFQEFISRALTPEDDWNPVPHFNRFQC